jgi:hypothetical protein
MKELRDKLLTSSAEDIGLSGEDAKAKVWGVMMEHEAGDVRGAYHTAARIISCMDD